MKVYIKPIIEMIETHTTLLSGSGGGFPSGGAGGFDNGGSGQTDGYVVTKNDPNHGGEDDF